MANGTSGRLDQIIATRVQQGEAIKQRDQQREQMVQQERMQKRALRQQAVFGTIQAGLGAANLGVGIAGLVQRGSQFATQAGIQQQGIDLQQQRDQYGQSKDMMQTILGGAQATSQIMGAKTQMDRDAQTYGLATTHGTQQQLTDIGTEQQSLNFERIRQGDANALAQGLRDGSVTYPAGVRAQIIRDEHTLTNLDSIAGSLSPDHRAIVSSELNERIKANRFMVQKNTMRPMTDKESAQNSIQYVGDPVTGQQIRKERDRSTGVWRESVTEKEKNDFEIAKLIAVEDHKAKAASRTGKSSTPVYREDGTVDTNAMDADFMLKSQEYVMKAKQARYDSIVKLNAVPTNKTIALPSDNFMPTTDEMQAHYNSMFSAPRSAAARINMPGELQKQALGVFDQMRGFSNKPDTGIPQQPTPGLPNDIGNRSAVGNMLPDSGLGGTQGMPGTMPEELPVPPGQPTTSTRGSTLQQQGSPGAITKINPPLQNIPASTPKAAKVTQTYMQEAEAVPVPAGMQKSTIKLSGTNVAAMLGLDEVVIFSDGNGEVPLLTNKALFERYNREAPNGSRFIGPDGNWYKTSKPATK